MEILAQFALALFGTLGFSVIFRVPVKHIPPCITIGGIGWIVYVLTESVVDSPAMGCFMGACAVGLLSTIAAYIFKDATTIFIIPGILCLVPGAKIFYTMEAFIRHDVQATAEEGVEMLMMAGAIAIGLLVIGVICKVVIAISKKAENVGSIIKKNLQKRQEEFIKSKEEDLFR